MYIIIWKYNVKPEYHDQFVEYYKSDGEWVKFFQQDANYVGTDFFRNDKNEFVTIDQWISRDAHEKFKKDHAEKYSEIDHACEQYTITETFLGDYFSLD